VVVTQSLAQIHEELRRVSEVEECERFDLHLDGFDVKRGLFAKLVPLLSG
jgi:hypothetical protein